MIPLILKLKKGEHKEIAKAQDIVITEIYNIFNNAVLHGGTAIWRCYHGNRFSEDIDMYLQKNKKRINMFFKNLEKKGFTIKKKKITEKSIYSTIVLGKTYIRFEAIFKRAKGILREYENADGTFTMVYVLSPEDLIKEKISAYLSRFKVRDLYDIFFLLGQVKERKKVIKDITYLLNRFKMPIDDKELKVLIINGIIPTTQQMKEYIERWIKWESKNT